MALGVDLADGALRGVLLERQALHRHVLGSESIRGEAHRLRELATDQRDGGPEAPVSENRIAQDDARGVRLAPETLRRSIEVALAEGKRLHLLHAVGHRGERAVRGEAENRLRASRDDADVSGEEAILRLAPDGTLATVEIGR